MAAQNAEDFLLRLNQQISGPASVAAGALVQLEGQIKAEQGALAGLNASLSASKTKLTEMQAAGAAARASGIEKQTAAAGDLAERLDYVKRQIASIAAAGSGGDVGALAKLKTEAADLGGKLSEAKAKLTALESGGPANADAAKAMKAKIADLEGKAGAKGADIGKLQTHLPNLRAKADAGNAELAANKAKAAAEAAKKGTASVTELSDAAKGADGPLGKIANGFDKIKSAGAAGVFVAIAVAIIAIGVAAIAAAVALTQFALASADASRSSALLSRSAAGGSAAGAELEAVINDVANKTPMARDRIAEMARSMEVAHLAGRNMQNALEAATTASSAMGDAAGNALKGIAEKAQAARRFMLSKNDLTGLSAELEGTGLAFNDVATAVAAAQGVSVERAAQMIRKGQVSVKVGLEAMNAAVQAKFGKTVAAQMLSLNTQFAKMKEGIGRLFDGVDIEPFLRGLKLITGLFSEQTVTGAALKTLFNSMFSGMAAASESVFPIISAYLRGMVVAALAMYIGYIKVSKAIKEAFGGDSASKIDWIKTAMYAGMISVIALGAVLFALVGIIALVIASAVVMAVIILSPFLLAAAAVYLLVAAFNWVTTTLNDAVIGAFRAAGAAISGAFSAAGAAVGAAFSYIVSLLSAFTGIDLAAAGTKIVQGLVNGIKSGATFVIEAIKSLGTSAMTALTSVLGIHSPSRVFATYGKFTAEGFGQGVEAGTPEANESVQRLGDAEPSSDGPQKVSAPRGGDTFNFYYTGSMDSFDDFRRRVLDVFEQETRGGPDFAT